MYISIRNTLRSIILGFFLIFPLFAYSSDSDTTDSLKAGQVAFNSGDYTKALTIWRDLANRGLSDAQVFVGLAYANGWGIEKDRGHASHWYRMAADNNNASAQFLLGLYYLNSENRELEPLAIYWLKKAADNGEESAINFLNKAKSHNWFSVTQDIDTALLALQETPDGKSIPKEVKLSTLQAFEMPISTEIIGVSQL